MPGDDCLKKVILIILLVLIATSIFAQDIKRFPRPEFKSDYKQPQMLKPEPRSQVLEYLDVLVLFGALVLATYLAHKKRSRIGVFTVMIFSLVYFGFWREGCVCSIGSIQNMTLAFFDPTYAVPVTVIVFFILPLLFALFFGRTFCAAVCPLGAIQDLVILRPLKVPTWLSSVLGIIPYFYLGLAVLFAATGSAFIICELDPFIGFFRLTADFNMIVLGICFLILGIFVARPYCRYVCPYSVLLNWMSKLSKYHVSITPSECIQCRLCEDSCPFGAINTPTPDQVQESSAKGVKRLAIMIILLPLIIAGSGWLGSKLHIPFSKMHRTVKLADQIRLEDTGEVDFTTEETDAFRSSGKPTSVLFQEALAIQKQFEIGSWILGGFIGLIIGLKLIVLSIRRKRIDYEPDKGTCLSCARCFPYCPVDTENKILNL